MTAEQNKIATLVREHCRSMGIDSASIRSLSLFGSRATHEADLAADWDVLVVLSSGFEGMRRVRAGEMDVVVVSLAARAAWLRTDLGVHVARSGQLLFGDDDWRSRVDVEAALRTKRKRTELRFQRLQRAWPQLTSHYRLEHGRKLRRDAQRVLSLCQEQSVPTRPALDACWASMSRSDRRQAFATAGVAHGSDQGFVEALAAC